MSKETITLDNFADFHGEVNGVEIRAYLPLEEYMPSCDINVHLGRISRAARFGHLGSLAFRRYSEQYSMTPGIASVGEDGSATASFSASATKTPRMNTTIDSAKVVPVFNRGTGHMNINLGHEDMNEVDLRQAEPWARHINKTISESLQACSNKNLSREFGGRIVIAGPLVVGPVAIAAIGGMTPAIGAYAELVGVMNMFICTMARLDGGRGETSFFVPGLPLDRMGLVQAYARTRKFVETA